jgi:DNA processing protein
MNSNDDIFNLAYLLLNPKMGSKSIRREGGKLKKCPESFRENLIKEKIHIIPFWDEKYPCLLKEISYFPTLLFAKGDISLLKKECVTFVGSRKMTKYSEDVLEKFFSEFKKTRRKDICFVSGLAYGVDSEVHRLCLKKNLPTIGIVGGGLDRVYYRGNPVMYRYLCKYRLVLSEFPPGRTFFKGMFPMRNRILAGISKKTFVIQAGEVSGALNTATHANNAGRDVFVIPNGIFSKESQGSLRLISQGAEMILNIDDFLYKLKEI